ncbi:unnamed protein product [Closterium sp. Yama58-4]|nr:unnamed protein product [Closterium sp. Yama58-4]
MADEEINYESDAGLDSLFFTRPKGPNPPPTPYLYVANCGAEAEMTYAALADVFSSFGHVRRVIPAGAANLTRCFVVFGGSTRAAASAAAEAALQALSGKPCAEAGGRKMHIQFAVGKRSAPVRSNTMSGVCWPVLIRSGTSQVLTGEARYAWSHYIPNHKIDHVNGQDFPRAPRRVSYTFRRVRFGPCGCAYPEFCDAPRMESVAENGIVSERGRATECEGLLVEGTGAEGLLVKEKGSEGMQERVGGGCLGGSVVTHSHEGVAECGEEEEEVEERKEEQRAEGGNGGEPVLTHSHEGVEECAEEEERAEERVEECAKANAIPPSVDPSKTLDSPQTTPAVERDFVHKVYNAIAPHFSATRFARWPKVTQFLLSLPPGSLVLDAGCGNGKYLNGGLPIPPALPPAASLSVSASSSFSTHTSSSPFPSSSSTPSSSTPSSSTSSPPSSASSAAPPRPPAVLIGCDISPPLVSICTQRGFEAFVADTLSLPLASSRFDAAISVAVLHHLSSEARRKHALKEMLRVVRRGGRVLVTVWAREQENPEQEGVGSGAVRPGGGSEQGKSTGAEASQEFLVPWHLPCHRVEIGSAAAAQHVASGFARRDEAKGSVVYNRYYYVFTRGELERLITGIGGASVVESFYDKSNWCVIMEKL